MKKCFETTPFKLLLFSNVKLLGVLRFICSTPPQSAVKEQRHWQTVVSVILQHTLKMEQCQKHF